jgi:membrane-associated phospholipid phosphatase
MNTLWPSEIPIIIFIQNLGTWLTPIMKDLSFLGTEDFFMIAMPVIFWCLDPSLGLRLGFLILSSSSLNGWLKYAFHGTRPYWFDPRVKGLASETSFGFPSGHSQSAVVIWNRVALWLKRVWIWVVAILITLGIAVSRIYLGVHFISDVIGGLLIGVVFLIVFVLLEEPVIQGWKKLSLPLQIMIGFLISLVLIGIELLFARFLAGYVVPSAWLANAEKAFPTIAIVPIDITSIFTVAGTLFGMIVGISWINMRGGFQVADKWHHKLFCLVIGLVGVFAIRMGLDLIFPAFANWLGYLFRYLRYFLVGLWVTGFAPMIFIALKWAKSTKDCK